MAQPSQPLETALRSLKKLIPKNLFRFFQPAYHYLLAVLATVLYRYPSRGLTVVAVTGTKGKSTTVELIAALLRASGKTVASASTIHFTVGEEDEPNLYKMTIPGRFFLQKFLRRALDARCTHAVIELTSEGARQFRHIGVALDALVFTNLAPEHIESHGSFKNYADAKLSLARALARSARRPRIIVANGDDPWGQKFLDVDADIKAAFRLADAEPYQADDRSVRFVWRGEVFSVPLPGLFNLKNCLATLALGEAMGLATQDMKRALEHVEPVRGRAERILRGQPFDAVVDYAHTMESLEALYETFKHKRVIAVIGATGGGRDAQKRARRGALAEKYAAITFITDEDPYDEDPAAIAEAIARGFSSQKPRVVLDRRAAIAAALAQARPGDAVLITGKGTDPYIMRARGQKEEWSDARVVAEELEKLEYH